MDLLTRWTSTRNPQKIFRHLGPELREAYRGEDAVRKEELRKKRSTEKEGRLRHECESRPVFLFLFFFFRLSWRATINIGDGVMEEK